MIKYLLVLSSFLGFSALAADQMDREGILRYGDGSIHYMNQQDAMKACPEGTHLPSAREMAIESQKLGHRGLLELNQVESGKEPEGYYKISAENSDGTKDEFYFNDYPESYRSPHDDLGRNWFWSSSVPSGVSGAVYFFVSELGGIAYEVESEFGHIYESSYFTLGVRCIQ